jgi:EAL domain-containing protein (putative c-di-GMP-specific phosphodiesterase class I)
MPETPIPIERDAHVLRARRTAAVTRVLVGTAGIAMLAAQPKLLPDAAVGAAGFATILATSLVQLALWRPALLAFEESCAAVAAILIVGMGDERINVLTVLWLVAVATGVMARGGRVHWVGRALLLVALALPVLRLGDLRPQFAVFCAAAIGLLLTSGRLTRELNRLLRQARLEAESAETLLLAGDIAARVASTIDVGDGGKRQPLPGPPEPLTTEEVQSARQALAQLIEGNGVRMVAQPIVDLQTGQIHAYEALARFDRRRADASPLHWFALAEELGERAALERACLRAALDLFLLRPPGTRLAVNLSVATLLEDATQTMLNDLGNSQPDDLEGLIIEITEETLVSNEARIGQAMDALRARGVLLAVDDVGAGYSGLRQITAVLPDYLKLDRSLISGIDQQADRAALVSALVGYCSHVGSLLVAEGVEEPGELQRLLDLGAPLVQGFYLARPEAPWSQIAPQAAHTLHRSVAAA